MGNLDNIIAANAASKRFFFGCVLALQFVDVTLAGS